MGNDLFLPGLGEFCRRAALGLVALLVVTRAYYPSEDAATGSGLVWVLLILATGGIGVAANLVTGQTRFRWSWVDGFVFVSVLLICLSAGHAGDRRAAITMAWEWGAMGLVYALIRNLPRARAETSALALLMVATAVAVATYGLYQVSVEFPLIRHQFERNPDRVLAGLGIEPGTSAAESFRQRLLYSNEPFSTFALANSLAGFIVGPLVILLATGLENLKRDDRGRGWWGLALAIVPSLILLVCLLLTKSRSAYIGFGVGLVILAANYGAVLPRRWLLVAGLGLTALLTTLVGVGVANRQLDVQILTEAKKSLGYRWEYWVGTWGVITDAPEPFAPDRAAGGDFGSLSDLPSARSDQPFWWGVGPANFAGPYLRHKLPAASEEIQDPHNAILEVWAESGLFAMAAFVLALGGGIWVILGRKPSPTAASMTDAAAVGSEQSGPSMAADRVGWLVASGGLGWLGVWFLGQLNPLTQGDMLMRWLILGAAWVTTLLLAGPLMMRRAVPAAGIGAAVVAIALELQAAGGIGVPSVAIVLWVLLGLGLNARDDQRPGRIREIRGIGAGVGLACGWAVLAGTFYGAVIPGWRADQEIAIGEAAMMAKPPRFEEARVAFQEAIRLDHLSARPFLALADLEYRFWRSPEGRDRHKTSWNLVLLALDKALEGNYRNTDSLMVRRLQARYARLILDQLPADAQPFELVSLKGTIARAARHAVRLYPTSALQRVELAQASADLGMHADAAAQARIALQLDDRMPHRDRKLPEATRKFLETMLPRWEAQAKAPPPVPPK